MSDTITSREQFKLNRTGNKLETCMMQIVTTAREK